MAVNKNYSWVAYSGNGSTTAFEFQNRIDNADELVVVKVGATGIPSTLASAVGYNATGFGTTTITVTPTTVLASGERIVLATSYDFLQEVPFVDFNEFPAKNFQDALDKAALERQQLLRLSDQSLKVGIEELGNGVSLTVPSKASRVSKLLAFDSNGAMTVAEPGSSAPSDAISITYTPTGGTARTQASKNAETLSVKDFGATGDGVTDDTAAIKAAIAKAALSAGDGVAKTVVFTDGTFLISETITLPNRVALRGENTRATMIQATAGFTGSWMFNAVNGTVSMFDSRIENMFLNCNNVAGLGGILSDAWQENSGTRNVVIAYFRTSGIKFQNGYGGAASCKVSHTEIFGSTSGADYGIDVQQISLTGNFVLHVSDTTIAGGVHSLDYDNLTGAFTPGLTLTGGTSGATGVISSIIASGPSGTLRLLNVDGAFQDNETITDTSTGSATANGADRNADLTAGINVVNDSIVANAVHFESCTTGFYLNGFGSQSLINCTGAVTVKTVVEIDADYDGALNMIGCKRGGATNLYHNKVDGELYTGSIKDKAIYTYPSTPYANIPLFANGDTTPDISKSPVWRTNNSGATAITNLEGGNDGDIVTILCGDANTTFTTNFNTAETTVSAGSTTVQFLLSFGTWYEISTRTTKVTYNPSNVTTVRSFDAETISAADLADVVGTLIMDLQARRIVI